MAKPSRNRRSTETLLRGLGEVALWALVLAVPFVLQVRADEVFRLPKLLAAEWLGLVSLLAFALAAAVARGGGGVGEGLLPWWRRPVVLAVAPVLAAASLGLATGDHSAHTRQALADLWIAAACLVGWSLAVETRTLERLLRWLVLPAGVMTLLAVLQFHGLFQPFRFIRQLHEWRLGVTSFAGNPGDLGVYLVLPVLAAQWGLLRALHGSGAQHGSGARHGSGAQHGSGKPPARRRWLRPALWAGALVLLLYGVAVTQTMAAAAALAAGSAVFWLLALPPRRAVAAAVGAVLVAGILAAALPPLRERVVRVGDLVAQGELNAALTGRLDGWWAALEMFRERPWTGVGHGAYRAEFAAAKLALHDRGAELYPHHMNPFFANAHNDFLEAAAEWGLVGVVALLWALAVLWRSLASRPGDAPPAAAERARRAFGWGGTAAAAVLALGHFPFHLALVAYPYLLLLAWVFRRAADGDGAPAPGGRPARRLVLWLTAAALAVALLAQTDRASDRIEASKRLRAVKLVSQEMVRTGRVPRELVAGHLRLLREARRLDPSEVGAVVALGGQYMLLGQSGPAIEVYREALALEPRPETYLNLGTALHAAGRTEEAREAFDKAVGLAPNLRGQVPPELRPAERR